MTNINDEIKVKLTAHGKEILDKTVTETLRILKGFDLTDYSPYPTDNEGYTKFQLWDFMRIFGAHFWNGCPQIIENNEIIFIPEITQAYAQKLFDTWGEYADNCLKEHNWRFLGFVTWLGVIKGFSDEDIKSVCNLITLNEGN